MTYDAYYAPIRGFLAMMARGWELPFVVQPMRGSHGKYSVLMTRTVDE